METCLISLMGFGARELLRWQSDRMLRCSALCFLLLHSSACLSAYKWWMMLKMSLQKIERRKRIPRCCRCFSVYYPFDANGQTLQSPAASCIRSSAPNRSTLFFPFTPRWGHFTCWSSQKSFIFFFCSNSCRDRHVPIPTSVIQWFGLQKSNLMEFYLLLLLE